MTKTKEVDKSDLDIKIRPTKKGIKVVLYKYIGLGIWDKIETHFYKSMSGAECFAQVILNEEKEYKAI